MNPHNSTPLLIAYCAAYEAHEPVFPSGWVESHVTYLADQPEVDRLRHAPAVSVELGRAPRSQDEPKENTYIWLIIDSEIRFTLEEGPLGPRFRVKDDKVKHTNLSGGNDAHCGGEMWFISDSEIWITGGSGRYPPSGAAELESIAEVFRSFGYEVTSAGWDERGPRRAFNVQGVP
jgi:hypothetical protein